MLLRHEYGLARPRRSLAARVVLALAGVLVLLGGQPAASAQPAGGTAAEASSPASPLSSLIKPRARGSDGDFLPVEDAFKVSARRDALGRAELRFTVANGYYLYRDRIRVTPGDADTAIGTPELPDGIVHEDNFFGPQQIYPENFVVRVPVTRGSRLKLVYQGCAEAGLCYPPQTVTLDLSQRAAAGPGPATAGAPPGGGGSEQDLLARQLAHGNLWYELGVFFLLGLGLAFTPCVLPMIPILSGIIAGDGPSTTPARSFLLSVAYVLGMALTYTTAGAASALLGAQVQSFFQQRWIVGLFAGLFVLLALSMFGFFDLQMPASLQSRFSAASGRLRGGRMASTALIGALSALVVTACVAPALVAALSVIAQTGQVARGAAALFAMSLGMGAPLLVVGASGGHLLPKAGPWMVTIKCLFGVGFLAVAAWMLERLLPPWAALLLYALVALTLVYILLTVGLRGNRPTWLRVELAVVAGAYALALVTGAATGATDPLRPLARTALAGGGGATAALEFRRIKTLGDLDREIAGAERQGQRVMLDFYADWCASCKEMDRATFHDPAVGAALKDYRVLQADVTANDPDDQALLHRFGIIGPPTTAFFAPDGMERRDYRLVGYKDPVAFRAHLQSFEAAR